MKKLTLSVLAMTFTAGVSFGQLDRVGEVVTPSEDYIPNSRLEQHEAFLDGEYKLPAKPRNKWSVGIEGGYDQINGDVDPELGYNLGLNVRKALGYATSIRLGVNYLKPQGDDRDGDIGDEDFGTTPSRLIAGEANEKADRFERIVGSNFAAFQNAARGTVFQYDHSFKQTAFTPYAEFVLNLNNINFHREQNKWNFELAAGPSAYIFRTETSFNDVRRSGVNYGSFTDINLGNSEDTRDDLIGGDDNGYNNEKYDVVPSAMFSAGISRRLGNKASLTLRPRYIRTWDDWLDGEAYHDTSYIGADDAGYSPDKDENFAMNLGLDFDLGSSDKRTQPLWWENPLNFTYPYLQDQYDFDGDYLFNDKDGDGVMDRFDKEPNSPCNFVDGGGVAIDSDKDGIIDCEDACPFTPASQVADIDANGCTPVIDKNCCDDIDDLRRKINALENRPVPEKEIIREVKVVERVEVQAAPVDPCPSLTYPSINFRANSKAISASENAQITVIASQLAANPTCRVVVEGFATGRRKVAQQVAWARAKAVADRLADTFGVSRDRIIVRYSGIDASGDVVVIRSARAGEYGTSNPAAPTPGM